MRDLKGLREELLGSIDRWRPEIGRAPVRSTLQYGILQRCYLLVDRMLEICVTEAVALTGAFGEEAVQSCCGGKPPSRMTLGERVQILEKLDAKLATTLREKMPFRGRRVLGKKGISLLHSLSKSRNLFAHDASSLDGSQISESLARVAEFCSSDLVTVVIAIQEEERKTG